MNRLLITGVVILTEMLLRSQTIPEDILEFAEEVPEDLPEYLESFDSPADSVQTASPIEYSQRCRLFRKYPDSKGNLSGSYPGSPWKFYERFRFSYNEQFEGGILFEKDPGETAWDDQKTGYLSIRAGPKVQLTAGRYMIRTGQGLCAWGPYAPMRGIAPLSGFSGRTPPIRGWLCADETQALQGAAALFSLKRWQGLFYLSSAARDAATDSVITGFPASGLHRTPAEQSKKHAVNERSAGGRISVAIFRSVLGVSLRRDRYSLPVEPDDPVRQRFAFHGIENRVSAVDWETDFGRCRFSGETARSGQGHAWMIRLSCSEGLWKGILLARSASPAFHNAHAKGFGSMDAANETGIYFACRIRIPKYGTFTAVHDISRTPWRTWRLPMPQENSDTLLKLTIRVSPVSELRCQWRCRWQDTSGEGVTAAGRTLDAVRKQIRNQFRLEMILDPGRLWSIRSRVECLRLVAPALTGDIRQAALRENGSLIMQDLRFRSPDRKFDLRFRWLSCHTASYDSRITVYEYDLPGRMSNPFFYGRVNRSMLLLTWRPVSSISLALKYGTTVHDGAASWGSGLDAISGDTVRDMSIQCDFTR